MARMAFASQFCEVGTESMECKRFRHTGWRRRNDVMRTNCFPLIAKVCDNHTKNMHPRNTEKKSFFPLAATYTTGKAADTSPIESGVMYPPQLV